MQFGFNMPTSGPLIGPEALAQLAVEGEAMGYAFAQVSDHVVIPTAIANEYPYSDDGEFPGGARAPRHEQFMEMMFVLARTKTLRVLSSVTVVPHRPAVLQAKMLASMDMLSGGRVIWGIGAGWMREEFAALQTEPFDHRGTVTDEYIKAAKACWTEDVPRFEGKYVRFSDILVDPKPVQRPHPPIWVGGESGPALQRTARLGDGWHPLGTNPKFRLDSLPRYRAGIDKLRGMIAKAGRKPEDVALTYRVNRHGEGLPARADDGERRLFSGGSQDIIDDLRAFKALGVVAVDFSLVGRELDASLTAMKRFREDVLNKV
jgi:probable F420-dependent oxidoreductase